jgi:glycosyltransferase involved in cell wall biosynthesis
VVWHYRTALETPIAQRSLPRRAKDGLKFGMVGRRVDACLGVTEALAEEVRARGAGDRARSLVSGCDTDRFRPDAGIRSRVRAELGVGEDELVVLHLGWHWRRKGGDLLVDAARLLQSRGVIGVRYLSLDAPSDEVADPIEALPFTARPQDLQCAADVFVSASRSEGFGNGLVEALACERVAVATLVQGQREIFAGLPGVIGIPPEDAGALAGGLERLFEHRDTWETWGREHRRHIDERYGLGAWARRMADMYVELEHDEARGAVR